MAIDTEVIVDGVTFEFTAAVEVGQYISGDWWAVDAEVDAVLPISEQVSGVYDNAEAYTDRWVHGLMVNPGRDGGTGANPSTTPQGWDSLPKAPAISTVTEFAYDHAKNLDPEVTAASITGPASLVKSLSILTTPNADSREKLAEAAILTIVSAQPASDAFRRWAGATSKAPIFFASDIDWSVLPTVAQPSGSTLPDPDDLIAKLGPLQTYMNQQLFARGVAPIDQQNAYGGDIANDILQAIFYTMTSGVDEADRNRVAYRIIQAGLDIYDATEYGRRWSSPTFSFGGAHQWLKVPMLYAARMLGDAANTTELAKLVGWCDGTASKIFADDMMMVDIGRPAIDATPSAPSSTTRLHQQGLPDWSENTIDWSSKPSSTDYGLSFVIAYRAINGYPLVSIALVARMLGGEAVWNNSQFFDYCDRWYNRWLHDSKPSHTYFAAYSRLFVNDYYETYWGSGSAPTSARLEARSRFAWIEVSTNLDTRYQPAATDISVEVDSTPQTLASVSTTASGTGSSGATNIVAPVITVASATGVKIGQRIECGSLPINCFVVSVSGTTIGISETIPSTFSTQAITFHNVLAFGKSLVAVLPTPLTVDTSVVEIGYTKPVSGYVRSVRGDALESVTFATTTNRTGQLPDGPTAIKATYTGATQADRQYSSTGTLVSAALARFRMSIRFVLKAALATNEVLASNNNGASGAFKLYAATASALRISFGGRSWRAPTALASLPLDTVITFHFFIDGTATSQSTANKGVLVWDGGSATVDTSTSTGTIDGSWTSDIATILSGGLFVNAQGTSGTNAFHGGVKELTIGWGDGSYTLPADFSGLEFAHDADWGANGENVWGQNQLYYGGTIDEWNGGVPNRGSYGSLTLSPKRFLSEEEGILLTEYTPYFAEPDTTAPTLTSLTAEATSTTEIEFQFVTNEANGTAYWFVSTSATPPSATDLIAGTGAVDSGSYTVVADGVQDAIQVTGLTAATTYYVYVMQDDAATNRSGIVSDFAETDTAAPPTWQLMVGETSSTLTIATVTADDYGRRFRCVVSGVGTVTSQSAEIVEP